MSHSDFQPCIVMPVYNHGLACINTVSGIRQGHELIPILLVDDGSDAVCRKQLEEYSAPDVNIELIHLETNRGKGAAVKAGLLRAAAMGFSHGLQIDADGQHDVGDITKFLKLAEAAPESLIAGKPLFDNSIPKGRYFARYLTHIWVWINTLSLEIEDSMCGFRVYPLERTGLILRSEHTGDRMDFDTEILVRWFWRGWSVAQVSTRVRYPVDGLSHFRLWLDNYLISRMHTRLFFGMLWRLPNLLSRRLGWIGSPG